MKTLLAGLLAAFAATAAAAAPAEYTIDPAHTYPTFEGDHLGISVWRGKFRRTQGRITLDKDAGSGHVAVQIDAASIDFGHDVLNRWALGRDFLDVAQHPVAVYTGALDGFVDGAPTRVTGELTLHGVTRPLVLQILRFRCIPHPLLKRELCGADALATIDRSDYKLDAGKPYGFGMDVTLRIQVEALRND